MIEYKEAIEFLYTQLPMYQREGASAYKPGLDTAKALDTAFGSPHSHYATIHVGGTNGKGSTSHTLAAILQSQGYRVGLYTSPHLVDFRERIRVNGEMISQESVCDFVERYKAMRLDCHPSFFELTMMMAFEHFSRERVDVAVIEVGLGGRLDSTNIIKPILSVITNISKDHTAFLGDTLRAIAKEKAGIMKPGVPVVVGEAQGEVKEVFIGAAATVETNIWFADVKPAFSSYEILDTGILYHDTQVGVLKSELSGDCQVKNTATILTAVERLKEVGVEISDEAVKLGFANVCGLTGLMGRWMTIGRNPHVVCDTGHNEGGWQYISKRLGTVSGRLNMVIGFVNDKDVRHILEMMPDNAEYYFTQAAINRAMPADELAGIAKECGLRGGVYASVQDAYDAARRNAGENDTIFRGGSTFVVADLLQSLSPHMAR